MNVQIDNVMKRTRGYWFVDGFIEMAAGGLFILLAGIILFDGYSPKDSFPSWFLSIAGEVALAKLFGILIVVLILWWLKDHFTYPRTGFVRGNRVTSAQVLIILRNLILFVLLPISGLLFASLLISSGNAVLSSMPAWFPIGLGILWAILCLLAAEWLGLRRFRLIGIMTLLAGIAVGVWQFAMGLTEFPVNTQVKIMHPAMLESISRTLASLGMLVLICGIVLALSGVVTFLRYRKENPTPYTEDV
ncbi:MAG: hypothetical protein HY865_04755 [Chloroflexi bacterium]|nr:hypothetical protein [Chloroflexota bacterium]